MTEIEKKFMKETVPEHPTTHQTLNDVHLLTTQYKLLFSGATNDSAMSEQMCIDDDLNSTLVDDRI